MTTDENIEGPGPRSVPGVEVQVQRQLRNFLLNVSFSTTQKRIVLFGPSGSGKSLTLRSIAGIFRPQTSRIQIGDQVIEDSSVGIRLPPNKRRVGYVPQGYGLFPHMTVRDNILYGLTDLASSEREHRLGEMLDLVGLTGLADRRPRQLSGGQQQRVALARALIVGPLVLLLDEPFAAIDAPLRVGLRADLTRLQSASGTAMITVTHDLIDAFLLGDWIVVMDEGHVLQQGARDEVYTRPATRKVAELVGIRNILRGTVECVRDGFTGVNWGGRTLFAAGTGSQPGEAVDVCIRSTHVMIRRPEDAAFEQNMNVMHGQIVDEALMTEARRLLVRLNGSSTPWDLEIDLPEYTYYRLGLDETKQIDVHVTPERIHLLSTS
jgi:molybdate transport system ATP-binding protein